MNYHDIPERPLQPPLDDDSYSDAQDILEEQRKAEMRDWLRGPIGQRPAEGEVWLPLDKLAQKRIVEKARELREHAELADGYTKTHYSVGDPDGQPHYEEGEGWFVNEELFNELDELLGALDTIEKEGW